jgi:galactoside O-acetyltransferase
MIGGAEAKIKIGNFVNIGPNCCFVGGQNNYRGGELVGPAIPKDYGGKSEIEPIIIDDHVLIGCNVVILPGVHLPEGVSVGAFSLLKKEVYKPWTLYAGIPARELGKRDGKKIKEQAEKLLEDVEKGIL